MADLPTSVAIVDDDQSFCNALQRLLRTFGFATTCYTSGRAFLAGLGSGRPDCLLLDLQMPDPNGLAVLQHLARAGLHLPAIIVTANADADWHAQCLAAGAIGVLRKPFGEAELLKLIALAIGDAPSIQGPPRNNPADNRV